MNAWRLLVRSLWYHRGIHLATALGVAIASAVLTGAFLLGDSVRDSLQRIVVEQLGSIDFAWIGARHVRAELADEVSANLQVSNAQSFAVGVCLLPRITVQNPDNGNRATQVTLCGIPDTFWNFDQTGVRPTVHPQGRTVVINAALAEHLQVLVGDRLSVRLPESQKVAAETPFGRRDSAVTILADLEVGEILPNRGLGRFNLNPSQVTPMVLFLDRTLVQQSWSEPATINAILAATPENDLKLATAQPEIDRSLDPQLADFGIEVSLVEGRYLSDGDDAGHHTLQQDDAQLSIAWSYWNITSDEWLWQAAAADVVRSKLRNSMGLRTQEVFAYLVNSMLLAKTERPSTADSPSETIVGRTVPYSIVAAVDQVSWLSSGHGADHNGSDDWPDDAIVLNDWTAGELGAIPADWLLLRYFEPETTHGEPNEVTGRFRVQAIVPLTEPIRPFRRNRDAVFQDPPSRAADPHFTPLVIGVTDRDSIANWDAPFPFDPSRIQPRDEVYWENHRTTPKAFISLAAGQRLWGSRFGKTTSFRLLDSDQITEKEIRESLTAALRSVKGELGFRFEPVKSTGLIAAGGATPFEYLFLGFSIFVLGAAIVLMVLLTALGMQTRWGEFGLMSAIGWDWPRIRKLLCRELLLVTVFGAIIGLGLGMCYAALMILGLRTWWLAATIAPIVELSIRAYSLALGLIVTIAVCGAVTWWLVRRARSSDVRSLLTSGRGGMELDFERTGLSDRRRYVTWLFIAMGVLFAIGASWWGHQLKGEAQAGAFFGAGAIMLATGIWTSRKLLQWSNRPAKSLATLTLSMLALRSAARHRNRSTLVIAIVAIAVYLLVAVSVFRIAPSDEGTGGFDLISESDVPLFEDLASDADSNGDPFVVRFSVRDGHDSSCRNLYQTDQPTLLGLEREVAERFDRLPNNFYFVNASSREAPSTRPWNLLFEPSTDGTIPVFIDQNTARYGLKLFGGIGEVFSLDYGNGPVTFRVAGLLANSVLQGKLIISSDRLREHFPTIYGSRYFLIRFPATWSDAQQQRWTAELERRFGDQGIQFRSATELLAELLAVQNTYLSTFQTLGWIGLLLGTAGLSVVAMRNILERRSELALMSAVGYPPAQLRHIVSHEHMGLLLCGVLLGIVAAAIAVRPQFQKGMASSLVGSTLPLLLVIVGVGWMASQFASWTIRTRDLRDGLHND